MSKLSKALKALEGFWQIQKILPNGETLKDNITITIDHLLGIVCYDEKTFKPMWPWSDGNEKTRKFDIIIEEIEFLKDESDSGIGDCISKDPIIKIFVPYQSQAGKKSFTLLGCSKKIFVTDATIESHEKIFYEETSGTRSESQGYVEIVGDNP